MAVEDNELTVKGTVLLFAIVLWFAGGGRTEMDEDDVLLGGSTIMVAVTDDEGRASVRASSPANTIRKRLACRRALDVLYCRI
eukprot:2887505-Rhodomonas_salina.1